MIGRGLLIVLMVGMLPLSGCLTWASSDTSEPVDIIEEASVPVFPEFNLKDHQNQPWSSNEMPYPYVAYFSATCVRTVSQHLVHWTRSSRPAHSWFSTKMAVRVMMTW